MKEQMHTIHFAAQHTGLSQHTIRAWERRYAALSPERTLTNRRLYSTADLEKQDCELVKLSAAVKYNRRGVSEIVSGNVFGLEATVASLLHQPE